MTNREFFTAVSTNEALSAELRDFAVKAIAKLDKANESKKNSLTKTQKENLELLPVVRTYLAGCTVPQIASEVAKQCKLESTSKASALLRMMKDNGEVTESLAKSTAKSGGKVKAYALVK